MNVFDELKHATEEAREKQDLPDFLAGKILFIVENRERFAGREGEIAELTEKVSLYDTYGQTGYLGMGVSNLILEKTLQRLIGAQETPRG